MSNPAYTPLGKKVDLGREVQGVLGTEAGVVLDGYNLGTSADGQPLLQGLDTNAELAFFRLQAGTGVTISPSADGNAYVITSSVLAGNTPGVMLDSVYDPTGSGTVLKAAAVPWAGITGVPLTFPPAVPIPESDVTNLTTDLASKVPGTRMINTAFSLEGGGPLSGDLTISLIGDMADVGPDMRYGTNPAGVLGWYPASVGAGDMVQAVYDPDNDGIVEMADAVIADAITTAMLQAGCVTAANMATGAALTNLGYTPVNKTGDTMTGQLVTLMNGPNINPNMYQNAHFLAEVASPGSGYPTIGLANLAPGGGSVALYYVGAHNDLNLEYGDGTAATLLSSISTISGNNIAPGSVLGSALATGAAVSNIGYRPVNWNGDQMTNTNVFAWQREAGLGAASWSVAPIRVQCATTGARAQIGFWNMPYGAASLYLDTDYSMRTIDSGGTVRVLCDSGNSPNAYGLNYRPVNDAGDTMTGDLWVNKGSAQIIAYQDNNNYIRLLAGSTAPLVVRGNDTGVSGATGVGLILLESTGGTGNPGMQFITVNGFVLAFYVQSQTGALWVTRRNDGLSKQLFP